jgi:general secretion pathway protein G
MRARNGFTLIELVIVILILGILAAVAAPKVINMSAVATDNSLRHTVTTVRDAIQNYSAEHDGALPGAPDNTAEKFKTDLTGYLRGEFPQCPVGPAKNSDVKIKSDAGSVTGESDPSEGWHYSVVTGEFIVNYSEFSEDGATRYDEF